MQHYHVNGVELAVAESGSGRVVLAIHGFPFDHSMWNDWSDSLQSQMTSRDRDDGYRLLMPDLRGFGQSTPPSQSGTTVTMEQFADDLAALLEVLGVTEPIVLCGLSMGGYITAAFARKYAAKLAGIVLCDTKAAADPPNVAEGRLRLADALDQGTETTASLAQSMLPRLFAPTTLTRHGEIARRAEQMMHAQPPQGLAAAARGMAARQDATSFFQSLEIPMLALGGTDDMLTPPREMKELAANARDGRFVEISGAGHLGPMEAPAAYAAALPDFCDRVFSA